MRGRPFIQASSSKAEKGFCFNEGGKGWPTRIEASFTIRACAPLSAHPTTTSSDLNIVGVAREAYVEEALSFCPAHSLAAHRPLGSIMRARLKAYEIMAKLRRTVNKAPLDELRSIEELPV